MIIHCPTILMDNRGSRSDLFIYSAGPRSWTERVESIASEGARACP